MDRSEAVRVLIKNGIRWPNAKDIGDTFSPLGWKWAAYRNQGIPYLHTDCGGLRIYREEWKEARTISIDAEKAEPKALDVQVGGGHYKNYAIQPVEYCMKNNLNYCQSNIVKYATRYKEKSGKEDLEKVKHYVDLLLQLEYGDEDGTKQ